MAERAGRTPDVERDVKLLVDTFLGKKAEVKDKAGARALVEWALGAGVKVAVASSSPRRVVETLLAVRGLAPLFEIIVTGDDVAKKKPEPDIFLAAAARVGVAPAECLVLEDSFAGMTAGRRAAMMVIGVPEHDMPEAQGVADAIASSLVEAATWIRAPTSG